MVIFSETFSNYLEFRIIPKSNKTRTDPAYFNDLCANTSSTPPYFGVLHTGYHYGGIPDTLMANLFIGSILLILASIVWTTKHLVFQPPPSLAPESRINKFKVWRWLQGDRTFFVRQYGVQNAQYLLLHRHIILLLLCCNVMDLGVLLPINILAGRNNDPSDYETSIISNVSIVSPWLWFHLIIGWLKFPIALLIMSAYSRNVLKPFPEPIRYTSRTVVIDHVPKKKRNRAAIEHMLTERYPYATIRHISLTYPMEEFISIEKKIDLLQHIHTSCRDNGKDEYLFWNKICCGFICDCSSDNLNLRTAEEYYKQQLESVKTELTEKNKEVLRTTPLDIAFIRFTSSDDVDKIIVGGNRLDGNVRIRRAPRPEEIVWENMIDCRDKIWRRGTNLAVLAVLMVFFTTPQTLIATFEDYSGTVSQEVAAWSEFTKALIENILPSFLKMIIEHMITHLISWAVRRSGVWNMAKMNKNIFQFATLQLLMILMVLPVAGFKTVEEVISFLHSWFSRGGRKRSAYEEEQHKRFKCAFLPRGGATFIDLIINDALLGNFYELLRVRDVLLLTWRLARAKSKTEMNVQASRFQMEFCPSESASHEMFILILSVGLSSSTPLILPFGLLYFLVRHCVLSYNLRRKDILTSAVDAKFHLVAISYVVGSAICLQMFTCLYFHIMSFETNSPETVWAIVSIVVAIFSIGLWSFQTCTGWTFPFKIVKENDKIFIIGEETSHA